MTLAQAQSGSGMAVDLLLLLMAAGIASLLLGRLKLSAIPGYLIAGVLLGAMRTPTSDIGSIQQIAVVLLMFGIGLNLDRDAITRGAGAIIALGLGSTILMMAFATPTAMLFGLHWTAAIAIAMAVAQTSTAVVLRTLQARRELETSWGRVSFGVLIVQDLLTIGMLALIPVLARVASAGATDEAASQVSVWHGAGQVAASIAIITGFILLSTLILPRLLTIAAQVSTEVMLVISAAVALAAAAVTGAVGMSPALGAFIAGFVLAGTPVRFELAGQLAPLRDLFMAVFFTAVGLGVDLAALASDAWIVAIGAVLVALIKIISMAIAAWGLGASIHITAMTSIVLFQTGEFSLVVVNVAAAEGLLSPRQESVFIGLTALLLIATPGVIGVAQPVSNKLSKVLPTAPWLAQSSLRMSSRQPLPEDGDDAADTPQFLRDHVVIAGFGPVGRAVADKLHVAGVPYSIVELNPTTVMKQRRLGRAAFYGDAANEEVLRSAGIEHARCVVMAIPDDAAMLRAVRLARQMAPRAMIVARAFATSRGLAARGLGATHVVIEELVTAEAMAAQVLTRLAAMNPVPETPQPPTGAPS
ncbi:MAG: cation:proton antiporter [Phycisphaeraceae bacterium]|nr:cation:proton antiporter [Phycisphaeraceae bacterium]